MSVERQFGVHEIPGTEEPAPTRRPETVSAGFELQMRTYVNAIWVKLAALEGRIEDFEGWRTAIALALKDATGIDPRSSQGRPMLVTDDGGVAKGEGFSHSPPKPPVAKPWVAEGVSKATWYRRHKEGAA
jgi:hypothetical protein